MWPIVLLSLAMNLLAPATRDVVTISYEGHLHALINQTRDAQGLASLAVDASLTRVARAHSDRIAAAGVVSHTPSLHEVLGGWTVLGENVAMASTVGDVFFYFMDSAKHRALIQDAGFTHMGAGVTDASGTLFVTVWFGRR
ncbi:MAG TPA: CAP domain-containing protein [Actinomycetota bacterium]|nr:CAP domain-containing protein [Actinomycetota bacterium]